MKSSHMLIAILCGTVTSAGSVFAQQQTPGQGTVLNSAQAQQQQQQQNMEPDQETGSTGLSGPEMRDRAFIRKDYTSGMAEIQLAKLALQKSTNAEVKTFAQMMIDDHTAINAKLEPLAQTLGVTLIKSINKADQAEYSKLKDMAGSDFDKEYAVYMVRDHRDAQYDLRVENGVVTQLDLKAQIDAEIPIIRGHLTATGKLVASVGATMPARPTRSK